MNDWIESLVGMALANTAIAVVVAAAAILAGRWCRSPTLAHALWILVLVKLITPPLVEVAMPASWIPAPAIATQALARRAPSSAVAATPRPSRDRGETKENPTREDPEERGTESAAGPQPQSTRGNDLAVDRTRATPHRVGKASNSAAAVPLGPIPAGSIPVGTDLAGTRPDGSKAAGPASAGPDRIDPPPVAAAPAAPPPAGSDTPHSAPWAKLPWLGIAVTVWLGGLVWTLALGLWRAVRFHRSLRHAQAPSASLLREARALGRQLGLRRTPQVRLLPGRVAPMLWGMFGPAQVLIPAELDRTLSDAQRRTLLAHEFAHFQRRDHWVRVLEMTVLAVHWWNPFASWACRQLREVEEECCDAWVIWALPNASRSYADALLDTIEFLSDATGKTPAPASGIGNVTNLKRRLTMIMQGDKRRTLSHLGRAAIFGLATLTLPVVPALAQDARSRGHEHGHEHEAARRDPRSSDRGAKVELDARTRRSLEVAIGLLDREHRPEEAHALRALLRRLESGPRRDRRDRPRSTEHARRAFEEAIRRREREDAERALRERPGSPSAPRIERLEHQVARLTQAVEQLMAATAERAEQRRTHEIRRRDQERARAEQEREEEMEEEIREEEILEEAAELEEVEETERRDGKTRTRRELEESLRNSQRQLRLQEHDLDIARVTLGAARAALRLQIAEVETVRNSIVKRPNQGNLVARQRRLHQLETEVKQRTKLLDAETAKLEAMEQALVAKRQQVRKARAELHETRARRSSSRRRTDTKAGVKRIQDALRAARAKHESGVNRRD